MDKLNNSNVVFVGTMNNTQDLPIQMTNRTNMIKIPLPTKNQREKILTYHTNAEQKKYNLVFPHGIDMVELSKKTNSFAHRDLQSLVTKATAAAVSKKEPRDVIRHDFMKAFKVVKNNPQRKLEREFGTWKHTFKMNGPKAAPYLLTAAGISVVAYGIYQGRNTAKEQMEQAKELHDKQNSVFMIAKHAVINSTISLAMGDIYNGAYKMIFGDRNKEPQPQKKE